tara:strand:+ start:1150 stop:1368 length:219 start_codon:yes stop_codon:yes gene_type:complete
MENEPTVIFEGFRGMMILAQIINLLVIAAIIGGIIYFWKRISGWNQERNQILHNVVIELAEIKKEMRKNRGL